MIVSKGKIKITDLSFAYQDNVDILKTLNYTVLAGRKIGIVGFLDIDKSILAHMMIRFFAPQWGQNRNRRIRAE